MRVSLYVKITLKDRSRDYRGITSETFTIGADEAVDFDEMVVTLLRYVASYFAIFTRAEELNTCLDKIRAFCETSRFVPEVEHEADRVGDCDQCATDHNTPVLYGTPSH